MPNFDSKYSLKRYPSIANCQEYSDKKLPEIRNIVQNIVGENSNICVVLNGSFARKDAHSASDVDFWLLDGNSEADALSTSLASKIGQALSDAGFNSPNPTGAFAKATRAAKLTTLAGSKEDDSDVVTQRMLLMMESTWLYNEKLFRKSRESVLLHYCADLDNPQKQAIYLLNDLVRYFRMICVNYQFNTDDQPEKWLVRNAKLRHSRVLIYAGLVALILLAGTSGLPAKDFIADRLDLTPLERVYLLYEATNISSFDRLASAYDHFLEVIQKIKDSGACLYEDRHDDADYRSLRSSASVISMELTDMIVENRRKWNHSAFEALLF